METWRGASAHAELGEPVAQPDGEESTANTRDTLEIRPLTRKKRSRGRTTERSLPSAPLEPAASTEHQALCATLRAALCAADGTRSLPLIVSLRAALRLVETVHHLPAELQPESISIAREALMAFATHQAGVIAER